MVNVPRDGDVLAQDLRLRREWQRAEVEELAGVHSLVEQDRRDLFKVRFSEMETLMRTKGARRTFHVLGNESASSSEIGRTRKSLNKCHWPVGETGGKEVSELQIQVTNGPKDKEAHPWPAPRDGVDRPRTGSEPPWPEDGPVVSAATLLRRCERRERT